MKFIGGFVLLLVCILAFADTVQLHFIIEPQFKPKDVNQIAAVLQKETINDSISSYRFFCGNILDDTYSDTTLVQFLNALPCDYAAPVDYHFTANQDILHFQFLSSNIETSHLQLQQYEMITTDSLKIGIITINSPDQFVKQKIDGKAHLDYNFFETTQAIANELESKTNFILLLSNLSKDIDKDLVQNTPINAVVSFDYQSRPNGKLSNQKTYWYSTKAHRGTIGTLQIQYKNGKVSHSWHNTKFSLQ